ncbi:MAG: TIGR00289 family protein [Euryarchaeota archaeon]|nr:TIGR00289 family protein [Euryarchaeota archaeon]
MPLSGSGSYQPWRDARSVKVAVLSSGGKDSSAAIWWAQCKGWDVTHLVTMIVEGDDSWMFQIPGTSLVEQQAQLCECKWLSVKTKGEEELEVEDLKNALSHLEIDGIVSGALRSDYQKTRLERMCETLGIKSFTPLWHQSSQSHMEGLVSNGFKVMITGVSSDGLTSEWLGRVLTKESLEELQSLATKYRFHVDGEGGEYETLVVAGPHMKGELELTYDVHWDGVRGHLSFD